MKRWVCFGMSSSTRYCRQVHHTHAIAKAFLRQISPKPQLLSSLFLKKKATLGAISKGGMVKRSVLEGPAFIGELAEQRQCGQDRARIRWDCRYLLVLVPLCRCAGRRTIGKRLGKLCLRLSARERVESDCVLRALAVTHIT